MRQKLAGLILVALTLTAAPKPAQQCRNSCDVTYRFCMQTAAGKLGKKQCQVNRAKCKKTCGPVH
jgi:hypothetical protein